MKRAFLILVILPILAMASPAFVPTKKSCQALHQDVILLMSYVAPCDDDINPIITQQYAQATTVMNERLTMCHKKFSSDEQDEMMDELLGKIDPILTNWQSQIVTDKPAFCQAQRANLVRRLSSYL